MTDKSDNRVGHLNTILARGGGNLNDPKVQMPRLWLAVGGGGVGRDVEVSVDLHIISGL